MTTQAERDRKALDEIRCPFCDETHGHILHRAHGRVMDCPGFALDDEAIRRGHAHRAHVVAAFRAAVDLNELLHSDDGDDCCACDLHALLLNHSNHDEVREDCPLCAF